MWSGGDGPGARVAWGCQISWNSRGNWISLNGTRIRRCCHGGVVLNVNSKENKQDRRKRKKREGNITNPWLCRRCGKSAGQRVVTLELSDRSDKEARKHIAIVNYFIVFKWISWGINKDNSMGRCTRPGLGCQSRFPINRIWVLYLSNAYQNTLPKGGTMTANFVNQSNENDQYFYFINYYYLSHNNCRTNELTTTKLKSKMSHWHSIVLIN